MTTDKQETEVQPAEGTAPYGERDWFFQNLVHLANHHGLRMGATLTINGSIVSGLVIGGGEYFERFSEKFINNIEMKETGDYFTGWFKELSAQLYSDKTVNNAEPIFFHMAEAQIFDSAGNKVPSVDGELLRGRIDSVDTFILGRLIES